jgi:hypothetical protein
MGSLLDGHEIFGKVEKSKVATPERLAMESIKNNYQ